MTELKDIISGVQWIEKCIGLWAINYNVVTLACKHCERLRAFSDTVVLRPFQEFRRPILLGQSSIPLRTQTLHILPLPAPESHSTLPRVRRLLRSPAYLGTYNSSLTQQLDYSSRADPILLYPTGHGRSDAASARAHLRKTT